MRPQYHLQPARGWMNDPCGPIYWKGRYHMFFQYNPHAAVWGDMHWAHAVLARHGPLAAASPSRSPPRPAVRDQDGCFTGTAVVADGKPTFLYTGVRKVPPDQATLRDGNSNLRETQCLAIAEDDALLHWRKLPQPVIASPPAGMEVTGFRDPSPWRDEKDDQWYMVVASGQRVSAATSCSISLPICATGSTSTRSLRASGAASRAPTPSIPARCGSAPTSFPLDGKHVLIHSTEGRTIWQIGTLDHPTMLFHAETEGLLDHGAYYAPKTQLDAQGNRILWGWIQETRPQAEYSAAGWAGMMSLPRRLSIANGALVMEPGARDCIPANRGAAPDQPSSRLPTAAQELRLTLSQQPGHLPFEQSFVDNQGAAILLRADPQHATRDRPRR